MQDVKVIDEMWRTVQAGEYWSGEIINKRKDGTLYYEENAVTPLMDSKGEVTHIIQIKVDITERKNAEAALRKNSLLQENMASLGRELAATLDLEVIYQQAERYIKEMIDSPIFGITLFDAEQNALKAAYYASDGIVHDPKNLQRSLIIPNTHPLAARMPSP